MKPRVFRVGVPATQAPVNGPENRARMIELACRHAYLIYHIADKMIVGKQLDDHVLTL
jgi:hypothetical protein